MQRSTSSLYGRQEAEAEAAKEACAAWGGRVYIGVKGQLLAAYSWCLRLETCHAPPRLAPDEMLPALSPIFAFLFLVFFIKSNEPNKKTLI